MDRYPFDDQRTEGGDISETSATESLDFTEEFDISSFDFTIADPGEIQEFSQWSQPSEESEESAESAEPSSEMSELFGETEKQSKFSFRKWADAVSDKVSRFMEDSPKEKKSHPSNKKKDLTSEVSEEEKAEESDDFEEAEDFENFEEPSEQPATEEFAEQPAEEPVQDAEPSAEQPDLSAPQKPKRGPIPLTEEPDRDKIRFTGGSFRQVSRRWMRYALRPGTLCENVSEKLWPLFLAGVMGFFGGFYLLLGLDWYFADLLSAGRLWAIVLVGLLVGGTAAMAFAAGTVGLSMLFRKERIRPFRIVSGVAGACVYPAGLMILGLVIQLIFHVSVSMSFGIMAILWFFYLLLDVLRELFGEKHLFQSTVLLVLWGFVLFLLMSWTFTLK